MKKVLAVAMIALLSSGASAATVKFTLDYAAGNFDIYLTETDSTGSYGISGFALEVQGATTLTRETMSADFEWEPFSGFILSETVGFTTGLTDTATKIGAAQPNFLDDEDDMRILFGVGQSGTVDWSDPNGYLHYVGTGQAGDPDRDDFVWQSGTSSTTASWKIATGTYADANLLGLGGSGTVVNVMTDNTIHSGSYYCPETTLTGGSIETEVVPEPATLGLLVVGAGLLLRRRRRR